MVVKNLFQRMSNIYVVTVLCKGAKNLTRNQQEAIGLLSVGAFLEYFDLMLYVHMAVVLN